MRAAPLRARHAVASCQRRLPWRLMLAQRAAGPAPVPPMLTLQMPLVQTPALRTLALPTLRKLALRTPALTKLALPTAPT